MKTIRIERSRWVRGSMNGESALLNDRNSKCCLGFAICQVSRHISLQQLKRKLNPASVFKRESFLTDYNADIGMAVNNTLSEKAITINDDLELSESTRERELTKLFRKYGYKLVFVD